MSLSPPWFERVKREVKLQEENDRAGATTAKQYTNPDPARAEIEMLLELYDQLSRMTPKSRARVLGYLEELVPITG